MARKQFTMTQFQYEELQARYENACQADNVAERDRLIDAAWDDLGAQMGFYGKTVRCVLGDARTFTAMEMKEVVNG